MQSDLNPTRLPLHFAPPSSDCQMGFEEYYLGSLDKTMQVFVKNMKHDTLVFYIDAQEDVESLKQKIWALKGNPPPSQQRLIFAGKQLDDGRPLSSYGVKKESTLHLTLKLVGGGPIPLAFADMEQEKKIRFKPSAPEWRLVKPGLNLIGKCENKTCQAYNQTIAIPKGFAIFNMNLECKQSYCPMPNCKQRATQVNNLGLFKCFYSVEGKFKDKDQKVTEVKKDKKRAPNTQMLSFEGDKENLANWQSLKITVEAIEEQEEEGIGCTLF